MAAIETHKMLALSTGHVTPETRDALNDGAHCAYQKGDWGWFVPVFDPDDDDRDGGAPDDLVAICRYAREQGCSWLMFDCDADPIPGLATYDW